jgi:hypothetical protein
VLSSNTPAFIRLAFKRRSCVPSSSKISCMMSSNASPDSKDSNSASSKPEDDKQPHMRWSDTSSTTNEPSSASATVATAAVARHPTAQTAKPRRDGFREQFLQKVRRIKKSCNISCLNPTLTILFVSTPPSVTTAQSNARPRKPE